MNGAETALRLKALHEASVWLDDLENRPEQASIVSRPTYIDCPPESILPRLLGEYGYGRAQTETRKLHDLQLTQLQLPGPKIRQVVALAISTLGNGRHRARLRRHCQASDAHRSKNFGSRFGLAVLPLLGAALMILLWGFRARPRPNGQTSGRGG